MKKLISMVLAVCMVLTLMPCAFAAEAQSAADKFTDVPSDAWYLKELDYAVYNGYISGTSATTFSPDGSLTRGQFVTILGRMLGVDTSKYTTTPFKDVDMKSWYGSYVEWARANGVVNGTSATTFAPNSNLTVEQMGVILSNYINNSGLVLECHTTANPYSDFSDISSWAVVGMLAMQQYGIITPIGSDGRVNPRSVASRAQGAVALVRMAKFAGIGVEPPVQQKPTEQDDVVVSDKWTHYAEAYTVAVGVHDELWASGKLTTSMTEKEKAIVYYRWMSENCEYHDSTLYPNRHNPHGALVEGVAVCDGLAYAYGMLLELEGIKYVCVPSLKNRHMFNEVVLDGDWYHVDVTSGVLFLDPIGDGRYNERLYQRYVDEYFGTPISGPSIPVDD